MLKMYFTYLAIHPHLNRVDSENVNTDWLKNYFKTQQHNCSRITLQQQHCFNKKAIFIWHHRTFVLVVRWCHTQNICAALLQIKHILCFVRRCTVEMLGDVHSCSVALLVKALYVTRQEWLLICEIKKITHGLSKLLHNDFLLRRPW